MPSIRILNQPVPTTSTNTNAVPPTPPVEGGAFDGAGEESKDNPAHGSGTAPGNGRIHGHIVGGQLPPTPPVDTDNGHLYGTSASSITSSTSGDVIAHRGRTVTTHHQNLEIYLPTLSSPVLHAIITTTTHTSRSSSASTTESKELTVLLPRSTPLSHLFSLTPLRSTLTALLDFAEQNACERLVVWVPRHAHTHGMDMECAEVVRGMMWAGFEREVEGGAGGLGAAAVDTEWVRMGCEV
ncbi:hypothetical protein G7K_6572-t1 [Saitoella complicata NRRL Y-17804]|uniref:Uncharacterized protein n=1 Tax=Saitoella complicata (strain BCRC 22490 / CBS 7301 / JCM 7358 / NBRC 10748 / NRRL Y-17804) TaxID=698492 RepID=A0A0E9NRK5_SAICN|nr:hypothetical protein G7K_6572-t1 [Saitoella complicata NRRL Y-17804]